MNPSSGAVRTMSVASRPDTARRPAFPVVVAVALLMMISAFITINPAVDPETSGLTAGRFYELGLIVVGIALVLQYALIHDTPITLTDPAFISVCIFGAWALLTTLWSDGPTLTLGKGMELLLLGIGTGMIASVTGHLKSSWSMPDILTVAFLAALVIFLFANIAIWHTPLYRETSVEANVHRTRLVFAYAHPLTVSDFLALAMITLVASRFRLAFKGVVFAALAFLLVLTGSRGAPAGLVIALAIMAIVKPKSRRAHVAGAWSTVIAVIAYLLYAELFRGGDVLFPLRPELTVNTTSLNGRTSLWSYALQLFRERPLVGYGFNASRFRLLEPFPWAGQTHNAYIEIILTTGIIGGVLALLFIVALLRAIFRTKDVYLISLTIYVALEGILDPILLTTGLPMMLLLLAVTYANLTHQHTPHVTPHGNRTPIAPRRRFVDAVGTPPGAAKPRTAQ